MLRWPQFSRWALALFMLALLPRIVGLVINREANDNHLEIAKLWLESGVRPDIDACWECFQPPLYSSLLYGIALVTQTDSYAGLWLIAHGINLVLSVVIIAVIWRITRKLQLSPHWCDLLFLFFACNPKLVAINIQATNDTLLIAICLVLIELTSSFISTAGAPTSRLSSLVAIWCLALLAGLTKGNGLVAVAIVLIAVIFTLFRVSTAGSRWQLIFPVGAFLLLPVLIAVLGPFGEQYARKGTPFAINQPPAPYPPLIAYDGYDGKRLGVRSVVDSLGTFRFINLLQYPALDNGREAFPLHRTSFWTLLYGQAFHAQYEQFPLSWANRSAPVEYVARTLYVFGLLPALIAVFGLVGQVMKLLRKPDPKHYDELAERGQIFDLLIVLGYLNFLVLYSLDYRDFAYTKLIFILPALGPFIRIFALGIEMLLSRINSLATPANRRFQAALSLIFTTMIVLYFLNLLLLYGTILGSTAILERIPM